MKFLIIQFPNVFLASIKIMKLFIWTGLILNVCYQFIKRRTFLIVIKTMTVLEKFWTLIKLGWSRHF